MHSKKVKILTYIALGIWAVFTVSLILFFTDMRNLVFMLMTLTSGFLGLAFYVVVRSLTKEKKYVNTEDSPEPAGGEDSPEDENIAESDENAADETSAEELRNDDAE